MSCSSSFSLMSSKAKPSTLLTERTSVLLPCPAAGARASCARRAHSTNVRSTPDKQQVERPLEIWHSQQPLGNMAVPDSHRCRHAPQRHFEGGVGDTRNRAFLQRRAQFMKLINIISKNQCIGFYSPRATLIIPNI